VTPSHQSEAWTFVRSAPRNMPIGQPDPPSAPSELRLRRDKKHSWLVNAFKPAYEDDSTSATPDLKLVRPHVLVTLGTVKSEAQSSLVE
jgi:hypothetical protein